MYYKLFNLFKKFIRSFAVGNDEKSLSESDEKIGIVFICCLMWIFQSTYLYFIGLPVDASITFSCFLFVIALLFLFKYKIISSNKFNHLNVLISVFGIWAANMDAGMGVNPSLIWFGAIPLFAVMLTGIRAGLYWSIFSALLSYTSMILARKFGYTFNEYNTEQWNLVASSNMLTAPVLYFGTFAYIYNKKDKKIEINQKFADVGKSSAFVIHEISKPINRIMQKNCNIEDEIKSIIDIYSLSESLRNNQLKDITLGKVDLLEMINSTLEKYRTYIDFFNIQIEVKGINLYIETDARFLSIIIDNLIKNAIEACSELPENKYIRISAVNRELLFENSASEQILSSDQLLSPMHSSKPGHLGVGLYISKNLITSLGGELVIDKNRPAGIFQIRLKFSSSLFLSA